MPRLQALPEPDVQRLTRCLWQGLLLAALLVTCLPALRVQTAIGYLPLWLLAGPTAALLAAYRRRLWAMTLGQGPLLRIRQPLHALLYLRHPCRRLRSRRLKGVQSH